MISRILDSDFLAGVAFHPAILDLLANKLLKMDYSEISKCDRSSEELITGVDMLTIELHSSPELGSKCVYINNLS